MLHFSDGMGIDTSGPERVILKSDGYYLVGNGGCCPLSDKEAEKESKRIAEKKCNTK